MTSPERFVTRRPRAVSRTLNIQLLTLHKVAYKHNRKTAHFQRQALWYSPMAHSINPGLKRLADTHSDDKCAEVLSLSSHLKKPVITKALDTIIRKIVEDERGRNESALEL